MIGALISFGFRNLGVAARMSSLAISRDLGNLIFKDSSLAQGRPSGVIAAPHICTLRLPEKAEFLILACDGFWDVIPPQKAVNIAHALLKKIRARKGLPEPESETSEEQRLKQQPSTHDLEIVSRNLVRYARKKGSRDNMSVIVVPVNFL